MAELLSVSDHLGECEACRLRIESATNGDTAFFTLRAEVFGETAIDFSSQPVRAHLPAEQIAGYVDRDLPGEELQMVIDHLSTCEQCALAVDDLNAFRDQIAPTLEREYHPASVPSPTEGWWQRTFASLTSCSAVSRTGFWRSVGVLLLAVTGWLIWRRARKRVEAGGRRFTLSHSATRSFASNPLRRRSDRADAARSTAVVAQLNDGAGGQLTLDRKASLRALTTCRPLTRAG